MDWDKNISETTLVQNQDVGLTKKHMAKTSWRDWHGPQSGIIKELDEAIPEEGKCTTTDPGTEEKDVKAQRELRSNLR